MASQERARRFAPDELERLGALEAVCRSVHDAVRFAPALAGWECAFITYQDGPEGDERTIRLEIQIAPGVGRATDARR